ncbi:MAG: hypothetical protein ACK41Q_03115 [Candidatus Brocadia sp.]
MAVLVLQGKAMKGIIKHTLKKVTLELVYQVVDERTIEIVSEIKEIKKRQEDDFQYLVQKIDTEIEQLRNEVKSEIGQLRNEVKGEVGQLRSEIKGDIGQLKADMGAINQRIDTIIQMLMTVKQDQK